MSNNVTFLGLKNNIARTADFQESLDLLNQKALLCPTLIRAINQASNPLYNRRS
jgi:hypothetical protein